MTRQKNIASLEDLLDKWLNRKRLFFLECLIFPVCWKLTEFQRRENRFHVMLQWKNCMPTYGNEHSKIKDSHCKGYRGENSYLCTLRNIVVWHRSIRLYFSFFHPLALSPAFQSHVSVQKEAHCAIFWIYGSTCQVVNGKDPCIVFFLHFVQLINLVISTRVLFDILYPTELKRFTRKKNKNKKTDRWRMKIEERCIPRWQSFTVCNCD